MWPVFNDFEIERVDGELHIFALPKPHPGTQADDDGGGFLELHRRVKMWYAPLTRYPDLFIRFARLYPGQRVLKEDEMLEIAFGWARNYGILGVEGVDPSADRDKRRSGRRENVATFMQEVKTAAFVLDAFIAVNSDDPETMLDCVLRNWATTPRIQEDLQVLSPVETKFMLAHNVRERVGQYLERDCYPALHDMFGRFSQGWGFRSLLGAMYLQMMFYILEPKMLRWCKATDCDELVTFEGGTGAEGLSKGARGKYRTRGDKEYCSKACAERMRYRRKKNREPADTR
jgi:hypothetical protein